MAHRLLTLNHEKQHYSLLLPYFWRATTANSREKSFVLCLTTRHTSYVIRIKTIVPLTALIVSPEIWTELETENMKSAKMLQILFFAEVSQRNMLLTAVPEVQCHAGRLREGQQFWKH